MALRIDDTGRIVCNFSCGTASACATRLMLDRFGDRVHIVNAYVANEDADNRRFLADCQEWFGHPITVLSDTKYGADVREVWRRTRFIVSRAGAKCSKLLKGKVLDAYSLPGDIQVLGYTADARDAARFDRYLDAHSGSRAMAPLIDAGMTKRDCLRMVTRAGIQLPRMNRLGYHNANCKGCCRGGMGYWNRIRVDFPEDFEETAQIQDELGPGSYFFRDRETGKRISLRMLDPKAGRFSEEPSVECGAVCEMPDDDTGEGLV